MSAAKVQINKRAKTVTRDELLQWSKEQLVDKVLKLEAYNFQLKSILQKKLGNDEGSQLQQLHNNCDNIKDDLMQVDSVQEEQPAKKLKKRKFDFSKTHKRHVLLKLLYFGWDYQGLACQEDSIATIEHHLFQALTRTCLIESRATANYHRCGRTDKEVSAFCQVISIDLRSKFAAAQQLQPEALAAEIDYCELLNRVLPHNLQLIAWMPLRSAVYSARFDCVGRTYRYYFPKGDLNVEAMQAACKRLQGEADFRNFCKMDVNNGVTNYVRHIYKASIERCHSVGNNVGEDEGYEMYFLEIKANAFLWHQIRCIMAILLLIGQGKEHEQVISELLDIKANPCKPQYTPAIGLPLNLYNCEFRKRTMQQAYANISNETESNNADTALDDTTEWRYSEPNLTKLLATVQNDWAQFSIKCTMIRDVLAQLTAIRKSQCSVQTEVKAQALLLQGGTQPRQYQKLLQRKRCESLENRIEHFVRKKRLIMQNEQTESTAASGNAPTATTAVCLQ